MKYILKETIKKKEVELKDVVILDTLPCGELLGSDGSNLLITKNQDTYIGVAAEVPPKDENAVFYRVEFGVFDNKFLFRRIVARTKLREHKRNWTVVAAIPEHLITMESKKTVRDICENYELIVE